MKSVIAQGATVVKAIEEALKKADMPQEFFVKILEDAQSGFLGFGAKKAKIALFFKKEVMVQRGEGVLRQDSYEGLFNNQTLQKQIDNQQRDIKPPKDNTNARDMSSKNTQPLAAPSQPSVIKKPQQVIAKPVEPKSVETKPVEQKSQIHRMQTRRVDQFQQRELRPSQPRAVLKPVDKPVDNSTNHIDRQPKPEQRLQDIPQRPLPNTSSDVAAEGRPSYRSRRRSRYYSPRPRQVRDDGSHGDASRGDTSRDEMRDHKPRNEQSRRDQRSHRDQSHRDQSHSDQVRRDGSRSDNSASNISSNFKNNNDSEKS